MKLHYLLFPLLFALTSCYTFKEVTVTRVNSFSLKKATINEIEGEVELTIKNPNSFGFSIYPSEFDITYGDVKLGKAKLNQRIHIGAHDERPRTFKVKSNPENLNMFDILKLINAGSSGTIKLTGDLKVGKLFIKRSYPVNYSGKIGLP